MKSEPGKQEEYDAPPDDLLEDIARLKGSAVPRKPVPVDASILYPVSAAIVAEEYKKEEARRRANQEITKNVTPGQNIPGYGVFIGTWQPKGLSQKFNIFAAPEDLTDKFNKKSLFKYVDAVKRVASLTNWHGYRGMNYEIDKDLYKDLKDGSYIKEGSGWFIPPMELLMGIEADHSNRESRRIIVQPDNLYDHRKKVALKDNFGTSGEREGFTSYGYTNEPMQYWSSTEDKTVAPSLSFIWTADFRRGADISKGTDNHKFACRPVRLEPLP